MGLSEEEKGHRRALITALIKLVPVITYLVNVCKVREGRDPVYLVLFSHSTETGT